MIDSPLEVGPILSHALAWLLVVMRLAGLFMLAPMLSSIMIPARFKMLLVAMLGAAVYPMVPVEIPAVTDVWELLPMLVREAAIGFVIGLIAAVPLLTLEMAGVIMGQTMGFGLARVFTPEMGIDTDLLGQLLFMVAMGVFIALGGMEWMLGATIDSLRIVPIGGLSLKEPPLELLLAVMSAGFELALRVSLPVVGIVLLIVVALGVMGKTMPQLNVMTVGFMVKILAGLLFLAMSLAAARDAGGDKVVEGLRAASGWVESLGPGEIGR